MPVAKGRGSDRNASAASASCLRALDEVALRARGSISLRMHLAAEMMLAAAHLTAAAADERILA